MQIIDIFVNNKKYQIEWALSEFFGELKGREYMLNKVSAADIDEINDLSNVAKILLSAIAGASIQYLMDNNCPINDIFETGYFVVR